MKKLSRREFLRGTFAGAATVALYATGCSAPDVPEATTAPDNNPDESTSNDIKNDGAKKDEYTIAETFKWDAEYDVVVLGMGFAGMNAAISAANEGASVVIVEKMPESQAGGNSKVCGQMFAYAHGDKQAALDYYRSLAAGRELPEAMLDTLTTGVSGTWEMLRDNFFNGDDSDFHDLSDPSTWGILAKMSPEYPEFDGSNKVALCSTHTGVSDGFLYQTVKNAVIERKSNIDVWYESPALELVQDPASKMILGVKVKRGDNEILVRALGGVVVATGGFEDNKDMVQQYLGIINYAPIGGLYNTGDGIKMCQDVGADLWHMSCYEGGFGLGGLTYNVPDGMNAINIAVLAQNELNTGGVILVGDDGQRFINESETPRHGHVYENGLWENPKFPNKIWWIYDQTQSDLIDKAGSFNDDYKNTILKATSIKELAEKTGCDADKLTQTIEDYNYFADNGRDMRHDREKEYMRAFDGKAYYAVPMKSEILNTQGGPKRNENAQILDTTGNPIPHLYSAGEMGGITACMYQGGTNVAECFIFGNIAGTNAAAGKKDVIENYIPKTKVESTPKHLGEDTDLNGSKETEVELSNNEYVGTAQGMDGEVTVKVTIADDKTIDKVDIIKANETPGIGSKAIEQLPDKFVGLSTPEEIDAIDSVSGATVTSKAIREAVKSALSQIN
ncbi:FAD-dependent oxidoreductase [Oribacterium sp. WCC10]|uniref:FAD-dependent oxidoreductase n=1 Tax=Oribacterium sp. WCC10 TaxID=1855343 RepID=UPI0008F0C04A|nr:FAD-dependent oxidoreductase [Oribacterium sp. WCC10]SFG58722.1 Succinate dehydrogenase/fumarate reductase, flavoprotein subunit [Oribacterium sp. WCC10]